MFIQYIHIAIFTSINVSVQRFRHQTVRINVNYLDRCLCFDGRQDVIWICIFMSLQEYERSIPNMTLLIGKPSRDIFQFVLSGISYMHLDFREWFKVKHFGSFWRRINGRFVDYGSVFSYAISKYLLEICPVIIICMQG